MNAHIRTMYRNQLAENRRQGLCHVSHLLKMILIKYGIEEELVDNQRAVNEQSAVQHDVSVAPLQNHEASVPDSVPAINLQPEKQSTFAWFQPAELTM